MPAPNPFPLFPGPSRKPRLMKNTSISDAFIAWLTLDTLIALTLLLDWRFTHG